MIEQMKHGKLTWINVKKPDAVDISELIDVHHVPQSLTGDLLTPVPKNYVRRSDTTLKLAIDFPVVKRIEKDHPYEIKFLITKQLFITVQYEEMEALDRFKKAFEVSITLNQNTKSLTGIDLFFLLMTELYTSCSSKLDYVESILSNVETEIFKENERQMVFEIAHTSKRLISYRHILFSHGTILDEAQAIFSTVTKKDHTTDFTNIHDTYTNLMNRTSDLFEILDALRDTNFAMLTAKQNETMKILTIMAFITFPLSLLTSTFGMNTSFTPIVGHPNDFWFIVGIMVVATIGFFVFFRYKRWI